MNGIIKLILFTLSVSVFLGCNDGGNDNYISYTITFISNNGSSTKSIQVPSGATVSEPVSPTRADYDFDGWYRDSRLTIKVIFPLIVTENTTLYARWTPTGSAGDGTVEISTAAQLDSIRDNLAGKYRLTADISLSQYLRWEPIGSESAPFTGMFEGN